MTKLRNIDLSFPALGPEPPVITPCPQSVKSVLKLVLDSRTEPPPKDVEGSEPQKRSGITLRRFTLPGGEVLVPVNPASDRTTWRPASHWDLLEPVPVEDRMEEPWLNGLNFSDDKKDWEAVASKVWDESGSGEGLREDTVERYAGDNE